MKGLAKTRCVGGSLMVTIPAEIVKSEMLRENELVELDIKKQKKSYFGALKGIGSFTKEDELKGQLD
jgi:hypothetical protein